MPYKYNGDNIANYHFKVIVILTANFRSSKIWGIVPSEWAERTKGSKVPAKLNWIIKLYIYSNKIDIMLTKDKVKELVDRMPEPFSIDDLVDRVLLLKKIEKGRKEIENGEGIDWEDLKKEMDSWLK